jgi:hypothetical protein
MNLGIMSSGTLRNELYERSKAIKKKKKDKES